MNEDFSWGEEDNPFMPKITTAEEAKAFIAAGGVFSIESRIENAFRARLDHLKEKVRLLRAIEPGQEFMGNLLVDSILVDFRALFLESKKRKMNSTLQNVYRARRMKDKAEKVDDYLNMTVGPEKTVRLIVKAWVDQRIAHIDWISNAEETRIFEDMKAFLFDDKQGGLLKWLDTVIDDYEHATSHLGKNMREQLDIVLEAMTG